MKKTILKLTLFGLFNIIIFKCVFAQANIEPTAYGDFSQMSSVGRDYSINIGDNFTSGNTISSSEMNSKFNKLKYLIQELINNNPNLIIPDNVSFLESEVIPTIPIILYAHDLTFNGNLSLYEQNVDDLCGNDYMAGGMLTSRTGVTCESVKAVLKPSNSSLSDLFPNSYGPFYSPKGILLANDWNEFLHNYRFERSDFGLEGSNLEFWLGNETYNCNNWQSSNQYAIGGTSDLQAMNYGGQLDMQFINSSNDSYCSDYKNILCSCKIE